MNDLTAQQYGQLLSGYMLVALCELLGLRVTSWKRTPRENSAAGGVPNSRHLFGGAVDVGREAPKERLDALTAFGFRVWYDEAGTAPHYHITGEWSTVAVLGGLGVLVFAVIQKALKKA